ncbi:MAG: hypothetical protein P1U39_07200 [Legionellaceae bacterium]|nr:hypothetical protein [Legionellaceae bacterium]
MFAKNKIISTLGLGVILMGLSACSPGNEQKYSTNPKALQQAMRQCPDHPPKNISCEQLSNISMRVNQLAYKLRLDQQAYGKDILALQTMITEQRHALEKNPNKVELNKSLKNNQKLLQEHLAVVRWLASPEG